MSIHEWINEYGIYHKNKTNKLIHWFCVPAIMFSLFGLLDLLQFNQTLDLSFLNLQYLKYCRFGQCGTCAVHGLIHYFLIGK